jgi:hypothetical protein
MATLDIHLHLLEEYYETHSHHTIITLLFRHEIQLALIMSSPRAHAMQVQNDGRRDELCVAAGGRPGQHSFLSLEQRTGLFLYGERRVPTRGHHGSLMGALAGASL